MTPQKGSILITLNCKYNFEAPYLTKEIRDIYIEPEEPYYFLLPDVIEPDGEDWNVRFNFRQSFLNYSLSGNKN